MVIECFFLSSSALKVAQVDLASARNHMQQFQEISQANEAALTALNTTHDQYKSDAEAQISKHEVLFSFLFAPHFPNAFMSLYRWRANRWRRSFVP